MKKLILAVFLVFFTGAAAQEFDYEISGYVVEMPVYQTPGKDADKLYNIDNNLYMNLNRLRLRPVFYLFEDTRINIEYEIAALYFSNTGSIPVTSAGKTNRQIIDLTGNPVNEKNFLVNHLIDRLYLRQDFDWGNVVVGRQRIAWGSGRVWNPTDLFNPINPANFAKIEKDGADAVLSTIYLGDFTDVDLVFNPDELIGESNFGARFRTNIGEYDYAFVGGRFDERIVTGLDITGNLFGAGIRAEGIWSADEEKTEDNFFSYIIGIDNQFTADIYIMAEYHLNGAGRSDKANYNLNDLITGKTINLGRNYFTIRSTYQVNALVNTMLGWMKNFNDGSGYFSGTITYNMLQNLNILLGGQYSFGGVKSEYWYYGSSAYMQMDYYF